MQYERATLEFVRDVFTRYKHRDIMVWEVAEQGCGVLTIIGYNHILGPYVELTAFEAVATATAYMQEKSRAAIVDTDKAVADIKARATNSYTFSTFLRADSTWALPGAGPAATDD